MSDKYKIRDNDKAYFITITAVGWIDVFTRKCQKQLIIDSLKYCQQNKRRTRSRGHVVRAMLKI
jgi:hypothetical protein